LVDDEIFILQTLKAILRREFYEYELEFAQSGEEALEVLADYNLSESNDLVVFTDWLMPGMKGDELLVHIATKYPQSKNFLLSGMINREPEPEIFEKANIQSVIVKPWDNEHLKSLLKNTLRN
jgi:response regulator RpfG family c-di-GMP phosphodiesterase